MTNNQYPITNSGRAGVRIGYWLLVIGYSLLLFACGGGEGNNGPVAPEAASLEGDRRTDPLEDWTPAVDVSKAPTKVHGALAGYLPKDALVKDSVTYGDWNAEGAKFSDADPAGALLPAVMADYNSAGFNIEKDSDSGARVQVTYPQRCKLFVIRAPEAAAAPVIADKIAAALVARNFSAISSIIDTGGRNDNREIRRFSAVVENEQNDDVYVAYVLAVGDTVIYALETETAEKIEIEGGQISRVEEGGRGTRVGAMLISLVTWVMDNT